MLYGLYSKSYIWLNGAFGVGKSAVADVICNKLGSTNVTNIDSDEYYRNYCKKYPLVSYFGGTIPQKRKAFLYEFKKDINRIIGNCNKLVIIQMGLVTDESREILSDIYENDACLHFIIEAPKDILLKRIKEYRKEEDQYTALEHFKNNVDYLTNHYNNAVRLDSSALTIDQMAEAIINSL